MTSWHFLAIGGIDSDPYCVDTTSNWGIPVATGGNWNAVNASAVVWRVSLTILGDDYRLQLIEDGCSSWTLFDQSVKCRRRGLSQIRSIAETLKGGTILEANKAIVSRFGEEVWNKGNLASVDELVARDFVGHGPGRRVTRGPAALKQIVARMRTAFPDMHFTVEDEISEGDKVVTRWIGRGTHQGEWSGKAPTGKHVSFTGIAIRRIAGGKIAERWVNVDYTGLIRQIGADQ